MIRRAFAVMLLAAGCERSDGGDEGAAEGTTGTTATSTGPACSVCEGDPSCHSQVGPSGHCYCEAGHTWASDDDEDFTCVPIPPRTGDGECTQENHAQRVGEACYCVEGYNWCSDDEADLTCCEDAGQAGASTG